jgi:hypothetical protein
LSAQSPKIGSRGAFAASAKQSIPKNLGAVKSFLCSAEFYNQSVCRPFFKAAQYAVEIPASSRRFSRPSLRSADKNSTFLAAPKKAPAP